MNRSGESAASKFLFIPWVNSRRPLLVLDENGWAVVIVLQNPLQLLAWGKDLNSGYQGDFIHRGWGS